MFENDTRTSINKVRIRIGQLYEGSDVRGFGFACGNTTLYNRSTHVCLQQHGVRMSVAMWRTHTSSKCHCCCWSQVSFPVHPVATSIVCRGLSLRPIAMRCDRSRGSFASRSILPMVLDMAHVNNIACERSQPTCVNVRRRLCLCHVSLDRIPTHLQTKL